MKRLIKIVVGHFREKYLYYVCVLITLGLLALGIFRFPNAVGRLVESFRDFGLSVGYTFCRLFGIEKDIAPMVNELPDYSFLNIKEWLYSCFGDVVTDLPSTPPEPSAPTIIPSKWDTFKEEWFLYWSTFVRRKCFFSYLNLLLNVLYWLPIVGTFIFLIIFLGKKLFQKIYFREQKPKGKQGTEAPIVESAPLRLWHKVYFTFVFPVALFFVRLFHFIKEREGWWYSWLLLALLYFNVFTIFIELCAYYIYFCTSFDVINIYRQVYKLFLDLKAFFSFMPIFGYLIIAYVFLDKYSKQIGYKRLAHNERKNRGFINSLGVVTYIYAEMGGNKTSMLTDMALSMEVQLRDDALEIILECDVCFPNFPWLRFERVLKKAYEKHEIYDKWSCIRWVQAQRERFEEDPCSENIFGYDMERYPMEYDNKSYVENIWETLQDYALAYTIYTIQSSLIVSNYSIRVDCLLMDLGNFPLWDCDFFHRDSRLLDAFSRHSKILDHDMIRLGNQMCEDNPNRYAFGWGVWIITEADKEFKNTLELQEVKGSVDECNQKNDLTHVLFKMSRHACYIRHRNMVRIGADMQRIENITANLRGIGQAALIAESGDDTVVLPFFAPYRLLAPWLLPLKEKIDGIYLQNRFLRADKRLLTNGLEKVRSLIGRWHDRTMAVFGTKVLRIELQSGRMEGNVRECRYYLSFKKGRSKRNGSDCMASLFESRGARNLVGLDDMREYAGYIATQDELLYHKSYTQKELKKYAGGTDDMKKEKETDIKAVDKLLSSNVEGLLAIQNGKIKVSDETREAVRSLVRELCYSVIDYTEEEENADKAV